MSRTARISPQRVRAVFMLGGALNCFLCGVNRLLRLVEVSHPVNVVRPLADKAPHNVERKRHHLHGGSPVPVCCLCSHNVCNVVQCVTTCKKKMRPHAIFFSPPYFRPGLVVYSAKASATRECANLMDASAACFSMSDSMRFPAAS